MEVLLTLLLLALIKVADPNGQEIQPLNSGFFSICRHLCRRSLSTERSKGLFDASCREKCLRQGKKHRQTFHRSRRGLEKRIDPDVFNQTECEPRLRGNSSHTLHQLADNVQVAFGRDVAYVSWDHPEMPSNVMWSGYAIRWHTYEGRLTYPIFCKLYSKNQTSGTLHNGYGWNSSYGLELNVVLLPEKKYHIFEFIYFPKVITVHPVDYAARETTTRSKDKMLFAGVGGAIGGVVLLAVLVIIVWYKRSGHNGFTEEPKPENDVFITYSRKNEDFVSEKLVPLLENYDIRYQIDFIDFEPGIPWMENLTNCIHNSHKVLIVMSATYLESINCKKELREALNINKLSSLIVLRIDSVSKKKFPKAIKDRTFIDYHSELERKYWEERIVEAIKCTNNNRFVRFLSRSLSRETEAVV